MAINVVPLRFFCAMEAGNASAFSTYNTVQKVAIPPTEDRISIALLIQSVDRTGLAIAVTIRSLDPSLFGRLILLNRDQEVAPTGPTLAVPPGISKAGARCAPYYSEIAPRWESVDRIQVRWDAISAIEAALEVFLNLRF